MPPATAVDKYDDPFAVGPDLPGHQPNTYTLGTGPKCCGCGIQLTLLVLPTPPPLSAAASRLQRHRCRSLRS
jgi:hypothetical protein